MTFEKNKMMKSIWFIVILMSPCVLVNAAPEDKSLRDGNKAFQAEDYDYALQHYTEALEKSPNSEKAQFNLGTAHYKKGDYEKALNAFNQALMTDDAVLESEATFNIANCKYRQGVLKENTDLNASLDMFRDAMAHYKRAIELNPDDEQAKFNHEFVEKKIKSVLDKIKQQQEQQQCQQNQEQQGDKQQGQQQQQSQGGQSQEQSGDKDSEQQQQQQAQSSAGKQGEDQNESGEEEKAAQQSDEKEGEEGDEGKSSEGEGEEQKEGFQTQQDKDGEGSEDQQSAQEQAQTEDRMTEEEARMLLDSYRQREEGQPNFNRSQKSSGYNRVAKNW